MVKVHTPQLRLPGVVDKTRPANAREDILILPWGIAKDVQENRAGYEFAGLFADSEKHYRPLIVKSEFKKLATGDYAVLNHEDLSGIERKAHGDLYGSLAGKDSERRDRLEAEHVRMAEIIARGGVAAMVIEAPLELVEAGTGETLGNPPDESSLNPKAVFRTWLSWQTKYGVPWIWAGGRRQAEIITFRLLEKFWEQLTEASDD